MKKMLKNSFFAGYGVLRGIFFCQITLFFSIFRPNADGGWYNIKKIMLNYYYLGAGYEVRLPISLSGDLEPPKSDLCSLRFFIFELQTMNINSLNFL